MRWTVAALLRPITFALAIVAGVTVGNRTDTFWLGFLAFFIAMGAGRVLGALIRKRLDKAVYKAIWPGAATGFAFLFDGLRLPHWANFFVSVIAASLTKSALSGFFPKQRIWTRRVEWRRIDLDELLP